MDRAARRLHTTRVRNIPTEVALSRTEGLPEDCAVSRSKIGPLIATLSLGRLDEIERALLFAPGFKASH